MPRHWFLKTRRRVLGPITSKHLMRLAAEGTIGPRHGISQDGQEWFKAGQIRELKFAVQRSASPASPDSAEPPIDPVNAPEPVQRIWIKTRRGPAGPFTIAKLQRLIDAGRVRANSPARYDDESSTWTRADQLPGLCFGACQRPDDPTPEATDEVPDETSAPPPPSIPCESPPADDRVEQRRFLKRHFGSSVTVHDGAESDAQLLTFPPTPERPLITLVTNGLIDGDEPAVELMMYVAPTGSATGTPPQAPASVVGLMRHLASMVRYAIDDGSMPFGSGTVIANGNPAMPIAPGSLMTHFLFLPPPIAADVAFRTPETATAPSAKPRRYLWVQPISTIEKEARFTHGATALIHAMQSSGGGCHWDLFRTEYWPPTAGSHSAAPSQTARAASTNSTAAPHHQDVVANA